MRPQQFLVIGALLFGFTDCTSGSKSDQETIANIDCAGFSQNTCTFVYNRCSEEFSGWDEETTQAWWNDCEVRHQDFCVNYLLSADDYDSTALVFGSICFNGADEAHEDEALALTCDDVTTGSPNYTTTWPDLDLCPCFATGEFHDQPRYSNPICGA